MDQKKIMEKVWEYLLRESHELDELEHDLAALAELISMRKSDKKIEALKEYYERKISDEDHVTERIERRLDTWVQRLENLMSSEHELDEEKQAKLEEIRKNIDLARARLVQNLSYNKGKLHKSVKKKEWEAASKVIAEAKGDMDNPGLNSLLALIKELKQFKYDKEGLPSKDEMIEAIIKRKVKGKKLRRYLKEVYRESEIIEFANKTLTIWESAEAGGLSHGYFFKLYEPGKLPIVMFEEKLKSYVNNCPLIDLGCGNQWQYMFLCFFSRFGIKYKSNQPRFTEDGYPHIVVEKSVSFQRI